MSYLDPKEQVIDLELTSYGKYLLSVGKLDPVYYAFFDDDIIYDLAHAGVSTEAQSETEPRIQEETPKFSAQSSFSSKDVTVFNAVPDIVNDLIMGGQFISEDSIYEAAVEEGSINVDLNPERKVEILQNPISFSDPSKIYAPAWNVSFLKAPLSSSKDYLPITSSLGGNLLNIPQLNANISYQVIKNSRSYNQINSTTGIKKFGEMEDFESRAAGLRVGEDAFTLEEESLTFKNGATVDVVSDALILRVEESNVFFEKENFDVELFEINEVNGKETLTQIKFYENLATLTGDLLNNNLNKMSAEHYFDISIDDEIPETIICPMIQDDKTKQFHVGKIFNCEDFMVEKDARNIYTDIDDTKDICN